MDLSPKDLGTPLLTPEERAALETLGQTFRRPAGHIFISEGEETDFALLIQKGHVKVVSGRPPRIHAIRHSGEMVGEMAAIRRKPRSASIVGLDEVQVLRLAADEWREFLFAHPRAMFAQLRAADERLDQATRKLGESDLAVEQRLATALVELTESGVGEHGADGVELGFSQKDLATLIGSSTESSVKKILRTFKESGIVTTGWQKIILRDLAMLREIASGHRTAAR